MKLDQEKYWIILVLIAVIAFWAGGKDLNFNAQKVVEIELIRNEENVNDAWGDNNKRAETIVHIGGEVKNPGVFSFVKEVRLIDAIAVAGGETTKADLDQVNLARIINDGEHIIIPTYLSSGNSSEYYIAGNSGGRVNLNLAGIEELCSLTGIGIVRAEAIIEYRDSNGGFKDIEEIKNISGIGTQTFNNIKEDIRI